MPVQNIYLLILFLVIPLYAPSGYVGLGDAKARLYIVCSVLSVILFVVRGIIRLVKRNGHRDNRSAAYLWRRIVLLLIVSLWISSVLSGYFADAWRGADGWMMGLLVQSLCFLFALLFSAPAPDKKEQIHHFGAFCLYAGTAVVLALGILNRFRIYPLSYMGVDYTYLSTIGNIDWFCGYLAVVVPLAMGEVYLLRSGDAGQGKTVKHNIHKETSSVEDHKTDTTESRVWGLLVREGFLVLAFVMLILLGTESAYLILCVSFAALAAVSLRSRAGMTAFLEQWMLFWILPEILHMILSAGGLQLDSYLRQHQQSVSWRLIWQWNGECLFVAGAAFLTWLWLRRGRFAGHKARSFEGKGKSSCGSALAVLEGLFIAGMLLLLAFQVLFTDRYPDSFGSYRGLIWKIGAEIHKGLPASQKIFGIGPDCFYTYLLEHPEYREPLLSRFGMNVMNAHSLLLQRLLTTGLAGVLLFLLLLVASLRILNRQRRSLPYILMLLSYLAVGTVLFEQITCLPYMLVLLGMGIGDACDLQQISDT